jgi:hypothetical protein
VRNWYFGLHAALKLDNMTYEHFAVDDVVSDVLFMANPVATAGHKFRFIKLSPSLNEFGLKSWGERFEELCCSPEGCSTRNIDVQDD